MAEDLWLPKGFNLADGSKIGALIYSGADWQIYLNSNLGTVLVVNPELSNKWTDLGLINDSQLDQISFGSSSYRSLRSPQKYSLFPVDGAKSPNSKLDALAFSIALRETRSLTKDSSFHDAIYIEQLSRLLPTWSLSPRVTDQVVLGTWMTGGVVISVDSFRRLSKLVGWMPVSGLTEVISSAGFLVPSGVSVFARGKPKPVLNDDRITNKSSLLIRTPSAPDIEKIPSKYFVLHGRPTLEQFFNEHVIDIIYNAEKYEALGIGFPSPVILHGPPGCGKTFAIEKLVEFIDWPSFSINSNSVGSPFIHETSKKISEVFDKAIDGAPSVIIIDEMESFLSDRKSGGTSGLHHVEEVAEFLRRIPEAIKKRVLIVAMTNMIEVIDPAILRRGRFDHIIEVGMPSRIEVEALLNSLLGKLPKSDNLDINPLLEVLTGKPLSDVAFVVREAARCAAKAGKTLIDQVSIISAIEGLPKEKDNKGHIGFV